MTPLLRQQHRGRGGGSVCSPLGSPSGIFLLSFLFLLGFSKADASPENIDVIILGAGASGASAASEIEKWNKSGKNNKKGKKKNQISYKILEGTNRVGGRIYDVLFGSGEDRQASEHGGFRPGSNPPWENYGCNCNGELEADRGDGFAPSTDECPRFVVEEGAGWHTGDNGIEVFCKPPKDDAERKLTAEVEEEEERAMLRHGKETKNIYSDVMKKLEEMEREVKEKNKVAEEEDDDGSDDLDDDDFEDLDDDDLDDDDWDDEDEDEQDIQRKLMSNKRGTPKRCPYKNINRMFAFSQDAAAMGGTPLNVNCNNFDMETGYEFMDFSHYYGFKNESDPSQGYVMTPTSLNDRLPRFCKKCEEDPENKQTAEKFLNQFWHSIYKCVDPANKEAYIDWYYALHDGDLEGYPPYYWGFGEGNQLDDIGYLDMSANYSASWYNLDQTFASNIPDSDILTYVNYSHTKPQNWKRKTMEWCQNYANMVQSYLPDGELPPGSFPGTGDPEIDHRATQLLQFYQRYNYDSEYLTRELSLYNFGGGQTTAWNWNVNYSIDQRGLKELVKRIMGLDQEVGYGQDTDKLKLNHVVTKVDYSGVSELCPNVPENEYKVEVVATNAIDGTVRSYCAKRVISTVSFGVLQNEYLYWNGGDKDGYPSKNSVKRRLQGGEEILNGNEGELFDPVINTADAPWEYMGNLIKVYFRFPKTFWGPDEYETFIMTENFRANATGNFVRPEYWYNLNSFFANEGSIEDTKSLYVFLSSPDIEDILELGNEGIPSEVFSERIYKLLDPLRFKYGDDFVEPNCWTYYNWGTDPFQFGAYGVWKKGSTYLDFYKFYAPKLLGGESNEHADLQLEYKHQKETDPAVLYISGEQSCNYYWGYIEGAHEAGSRDARRVIKSLMGWKARKISTFSACGLGNTFYEDVCYCNGAIC